MNASTAAERSPAAPRSQYRARSGGKPRAVSSCRGKTLVREKLVVADELAHAFAMHHFERHTIGQAEASLARLPAAGREVVVAVTCASIAWKRAGSSP
jgi:hypothetical protein